MFCGYLVTLSGEQVPNFIHFGLAASNQGVVDRVISYFVIVVCGVFRSTMSELADVMKELREFKDPVLRTNCDTVCPHDQVFKLCQFLHHVRYWS